MAQPGARLALLAPAARPGRGAGDRDDATWKDACAAKLYATEAAVPVGMDAVQVLGGYGYLQDFPVERLARDAKLLTIGGGTSQLQISNLARARYAERGFSGSVG